MKSVPSKRTSASSIANLLLASTLVLALGAALAGCSPSSNSTAASKSASASSSISATSVESPAANAEIADITTIAYLGPEGTYTEEATRIFFGDNDDLMPQKTVADALSLVADGTAAYAVVPQENTLGGPVTDYIDAFLAADGVSVVGEVILPIRQTLMGLPGTDLSQVTRVLSHKQGLAQSSAWLEKNLPNAERVETASTAAAAQEVASGNDSTAVAIAAPRAANLYGLDVLQENVSQSKANKTRFYVVSRQPNELAGYDCAVFAANIAADKLPNALEQACSDGTELVCIHDRPEGSALGVYRYVIELERESGFTSEDVARIEGAGQLECLGRYARVNG